MLTDAKRASGLPRTPYCLPLSACLEGVLQTEPAKEAGAEVVFEAETRVACTDGRLATGCRIDQRYVIIALPQVYRFQIDERVGSAEAIVEVVNVFGRLLIEDIL